MKRKGLFASTIVLLVLALASPPAFAIPPPPPPRQPPAASRQAREAEDEGEGEEDEGEEKKKGKDEGKEEGKEEGTEGEEPKEGEEPQEGEEGKAEKKKGGSGFTKDEADELNALQEVSVLELDQKSPRFISKGKDAPPFIMVRPPAAKPAKSSDKAGKKAVQVDGSRWGFVDLEARRKRRVSWFEKFIAHHEKIHSDEGAPESDREESRKKVNMARARKSLELKELDQTLCQVELPGKAGVFLRVISKDRPAGVTEKNIREGIKNGLEKADGKVISERAETWRGKKAPGYTFIGEVGGTSWLRQTYFLVPKPKGAMAIVYFECQAPKGQLDDQMEKEFEAFIRGTQFN